MSKERDILEDLFKDNLRDVEIPVSENLWKRIKLTLKEKRRRRFFFWIFISGFGASVIALCMITSHQVMKDEKKKEKDLPREISVVKAEATVALAQKKDKPAKSSITATTKQTYAVMNSKEKANERKADRRKEENHNVVPVPLQNGKAVTASEKGKAEIFISPKRTKNNEQSKDTLASTSNNPPGSNDLTSPAKDSIDIAKLVTDSPDSLQAGKADSSEISKRDSVQPVLSPKDSLPSQPVVKKDSVPPSEKLFFIGLEAGNLFVSTKYSGSADAQVNDVKRNSAAQPSFDGMMQFGMKIKGFSLISGAGVSVYRNNYSSSYTKEVTDTIYSSFVDTSGQTHIYDSAYYTSVKSFSFSAKHRYSYLNIPLLVSYDFKLSSKWSLSPMVGGAINILLNGEAAWMDPESNAIIFNKKVDFKKYTFSAQAGLRTEYRITGNFGICLSSSYTFFLDTINRSPSLNIKPSAIYLNGGVRYYFRKP